MAKWFKGKGKIVRDLDGLDGVFSTVTTQILTSKPIPTLGTAYHLVIKDKHQRVISSIITKVYDVAALQSFTSNKQEIKNNKGLAKETKLVNNQELR